MLTISNEKCTKYVSRCWGLLLENFRAIGRGFDKSQIEDLTVLKRSPDLLNNVKIGQDQLRLI